MLGVTPHLRTTMARLIRRERRELLQGVRFLSDITKSSITKELWSMRGTGADAQCPGEVLESPSGAGFTTVSYKFQSDAALREEYQNPWGYLRHGKLFEDVDALAGTIANRHCGDSNLHLVSCAVIASVV